MVELLTEGAQHHLPRQVGVLSVFAHPDDESFASGGTLALASLSNIVNALVCFSRGEAGQDSRLPGIKPARLAEVREHELLNACEALEVGFLCLYGLPDGSLSKYQMFMAHRINDILNNTSIMAIITMHPKATKHPDHIAVTNSVLSAVRRWRKSGKSVNLLLQFNPDRLPCNDSKLIGLPDILNVKALTLEQFVCLPFSQAVLEKKIQAIEAHQSQDLDAKRIVPRLRKVEYFQVA